MGPIIESVMPHQHHEEQDGCANAPFVYSAQFEVLHDLSG